MTFCLLLPVVFFLLISLYDFDIKSRKDLDLARYLAANLEVNLAAYDQQLWQDFGMLAYNELSFSTVPSSHFDNEAEISIHGESSLAEPEVLKEQILRHMKIRFPTELIIDILDRMQGLDSISVETCISEILASDGSKKARNLLQDEETSEDAEWKEELCEYLDTEINSLYTDIASSLMPVHIYDERGDITGGGKPDFFDPVGMSRLADVVDGVLATPESTSLDKLYLASYVTNYFPASVEGRIISNTMVPRHTPDGRSHADLLPLRGAEAEEIITGIKGNDAAGEIRAILVLVRSLIQLIHHFQDEGLRNTYKITAGIIVTAVALISLGHVSIPLEAVEYLLLLSDAIKDGRRDAIELQEGHGVDFWPGNSEDALVLYYHDYLLLFLLFQKEETLLSRLETIISRHNPGPSWVWLSASASYADKTITFDSGYMDRRYKYTAEGVSDD